LDLNQGTLGDKDELLLTIRQQRLITELTARNEHLAREREQLRSLMEANSQLADMERKTSLRLFEAQRVQELEVAYAKLKSELERLVEEKTSKGADKMNIQSLVDRTLEENDRRREESAELRALLASRFEKHTSPRPDSGHSSSHSDDESTLSDIEDELCLERQCREQKRMIEDLTRQLEDRDRLLTEMEEKWTTHQNMTFPPL
uniref:Uncharacterized protein n=1 Tax=Plectus sambesii TaxID=2011161 RepID=A0A914UJA3_9BILA